MADTEMEEAPAPASNAIAERGRREKKAVEHFVMQAEAKEEKGELVIPAGAGTKLGEIENVEYKISRANAASDELKTLHRLCFGTVGAKTVVKKHLRAFCGLVYKEKEAEREKKLASMKKIDGAIIKKMLDVCDLQISGTKQAQCERLVDFLEEPSDSGKKSIKEKVGEKRKKSEAKKEKAEKKKAKKAKVAAKAAKGKGKGKAAAGGAAKIKKPMSAFLLYSQAKREKVKQENPSASLGEISKILGEKWKGISDERRANYQAKAAELKAEYDAKVAAAGGGSSSKKAPAAKKAKKAKEEEAEEEEEEAVPLAADDDARERSRIGNGWASARSPCVVPWWLTGTCDGSMMFSTSVV